MVNRMYPPVEQPYVPTANVIEDIPAPSRRPSSITEDPARYVEETFRKYPLVTVGLGLALGVALGWLVKRR